jgi:hypothetical protein
MVNQAPLQATLPTGNRNTPTTQQTQSAVCHTGWWQRIAAVPVAHSREAIPTPSPTQRCALTHQFQDGLSFSQHALCDDQAA